MSRAGIVKKRVLGTSAVRRGASAAFRPPQAAFAAAVMRDEHYDEKLVHLASRLRNCSVLTEAQLLHLKEAVAESDPAAIVEAAHSLTDSTAKLGAIRMMKLCIALQMVGRRHLFHKARDLLSELEMEYAAFKENLIHAVG